MCSSVPGSTAPCGRPSTSLESLHYLIQLHYACCIYGCCCAKHNSRGRSLSMLVLSQSDTHYVNRHMAWCGCHEILIALYYTTEVFCPAQKNVTWQPEFSMLMIRKTLREDNYTRIGDRKINPYDGKVRCGQPCMFVDIIYLCFLLFLWSRTLIVIVVDSSLKVAEFLHKTAIFLKNGRVEQQNHPFFANCTNSAFSSHYLVQFLNFLAGPLFLGSTVPFGRPSASVENSFILSLCLTITPASQSDPVQNTITEGVLSSCGCHERSDQSRSSQGYIA